MCGVIEGGLHSEGDLCCTLRDPDVWLVDSIDRGRQVHSLQTPVVFVGSDHAGFLTEMLPRSTGTHVCGRRAHGRAEADEGGRSWRRDPVTSTDIWPACT